MVKIIPSILTDDANEARELLSACEGVVDRVQIDIVDGQFADNETLEPSFYQEVDTNLNLDFHLMTKEPIGWVEKAVTGLADRIIGQIEMMESQVDFVAKVTEVGLSVGLAIDLATPVEKLDPTILTNLDVVLVMSVKAGFGGQKFDQKALDKIKKLDEIRARDDTPFAICVDGGVTAGTIREVVRAGTDEAVIGKRLFEGDLKTNVDKFIKKAYG